MDAEEIRQYVSRTFGGVEVMVASEEAGAPRIAWGDTFFMYDPDRNLEPARKLPFATIVTKDYPGFDEASNLGRAGIFRLNIGVGRDTFQARFSESREYDFAAVDVVMPHPVYGPNHWICVLNPSDSTFERVKPLLTEAYERAVKRFRSPAASQER